MSAATREDKRSPQQRRPSVLQEVNGEGQDEGGSKRGTTNQHDYGFLSGLMTPQSLEQFAALREKGAERFGQLREKGAERLEQLREKGAEALEEIEAGFSEVCRFYLYRRERMTDG